jgi:hypothetical protein
MDRLGIRISPRTGGLLRRTALPVLLLLVATVPALAAPGTGPGLGHLDSPAMQAAAGDVVLGAGAATAILAGMVVVVAASWRGFREMLRVEDEDDGPDDAAPRRRREDLES